MDKPFMIDKGFTLLEMMVILFVIGVIMVLGLPIVHIYSSMDPTSKIHYIQLKAMYEQNQQGYSSTLWFNKNGNVNHAQSIRIENYNCTIQLGFGRVLCENRKFNY